MQVQVGLASCLTCQIDCNCACSFTYAFSFFWIGPKPWSISRLRIGIALEQAWRILCQTWGLVLLFMIDRVPITKSSYCLYFSSKTFAWTRFANLSLSASNYFRSLCHSGSFLSPMACIRNSRSITFRRVLSWYIWSLYAVLPLRPSTLFCLEMGLVYGLESASCRLLFVSWGEFLTFPFIKVAVAVAVAFASLFECALLYSHSSCFSSFDSSPSNLQGLYSCLITVISQSLMS